MYRAVTRAAQEQAIDPADKGAVQRIAEELTFLLEGSSDATRLTADGRILDSIELHRPEIDRDVSVIAANAGLRKALVREQRRMARGIPIVMLGRDIGTVVLPDAELKLFVTASPEERATRRVAQRRVGTGSGEGVQVLEELTLRDARDRMREVSPLRPAADSIVIDTTGRSVAQSAAAARELVLDALARQPADAG
jgi:cytidylate kinase